MIAVSNRDSLKRWKLDLAGSTSSDLLSFPCNRLERTDSREEELDKDRRQGCWSPRPPYRVLLEVLVELRAPLSSPSKRRAMCQRYDRRPIELTATPHIIEKFHGASNWKYRVSLWCRASPGTFWGNLAGLPGSWIRCIGGPLHCGGGEQGFRWTHNSIRPNCRACRRSHPRSGHTDITMSLAIRWTMWETRQRFSFLHWVSQELAPSGVADSGLGSRGDPGR